jgi:pyruvate,water dikinase
MTRDGGPLPLREAADEATVGAKAANLCAALRAGLPVPDGFALPSMFVAEVASRRDKAVSALLEAYDRVGAPLVAARSSGIGEDSSQASFAGQHATVLGIRGPDQLISAVHEIWESAHGGTARVYREVLGIDSEPEIGVVIQRLVNSDTAGVLFTENPVTGADERVIDASWGLGEAVVGGLVTPDHFRVARSGEVLERTPGRKHARLRLLPDGGTGQEPVEQERIRALCLADPQLEALCALAARCEHVYAGSQDIEWAFEGEDVFLLQRRPLTTHAAA